MTTQKALANVGTGHPTGYEEYTCSAPPAVTEARLR
ncbi:hypothetical protein BKA25_000341 [Actinoalloteichus hymeniacidonis]|nr:hypothetical protein [Actinoalloteichus hymeniacidonis]